jgi:hypothetical protein
MSEKKQVKRALYKPQVEEIQRELSQAESMDDFFGKEGILARLFARTLEEMLEAELSAQLGYEKYEAKAPRGSPNSGNSRNGKRTKQVQSTVGEQTIAVPRDRNGEFASPLLAGQHVCDPQRLARLMIAACFAYIWIIYLGVTCLQDGWKNHIHRTDRCDLSLFQLGMDLLDHFLNENLPIPVDFRLPISSPP